METNRSVKKLFVFDINLLYSYLHVHSASQRHNVKDRCMKDNAGRKTQGRLIYKYFTSHFIASSKYYIHPLIIFPNSTCGIFFTFVSINLTHILQNNLQRTIMAENIRKNHLNYSKQNLT